MHNEDDKANIEEVLYAIKHIESYMQNVSSLDELLENRMVYDAVMMNFIIMGEACKRLSKELKNANPQIDWKGINGYRNFIAHEYFGVDENIVWGAIKLELPKLKKDMSHILQNE
jgi:uncharacterized protein with HEPN domain